MDALQILSAKQAYRWMAIALCESLAVCIDSFFFFLPLDEQPVAEKVLADDPLHSARAQDPVVRAARCRAALQRPWLSKKGADGGKHRRLSKKERAKLQGQKKQAKAALSSRDRAAERAQYLVTLRESMQTAKRICVTFDSSRGGGRNRTTFCVQNLSSGLCGWAPPQAGNSKQEKCILDRALCLESSSRV
jgi:hypothetical protein